MPEVVVSLTFGSLHLLGGGLNFFGVEIGMVLATGESAGTEGKPGNRSGCQKKAQRLGVPHRRA
jgi:hypothetical protein